MRIKQFLYPNRPMHAELQMNQDELFKFPPSMLGLEHFSSLQALKHAYLTLHKTHPHQKNVKWSLIFIDNLFMERKHKQRFKYRFEVIRYVMISCSFCTSKIMYVQRHNTQGYFLAKANNYHTHTLSFQKYLRHLAHSRTITDWLKGRSQDTPGLPAQGKFNKKTVMEFWMTRPQIMKNTTKHRIMQNNFGIDHTQFNQIRREIHKKYHKSFEALLLTFQNKQYSYRFLPDHFLAQNDPKTYNSAYNEGLKDQANSRLPNILLIITPEMKEQYKKFGQWVGFDLTFGLISNRSQSEGQYMVGVFAGSNTYKRVVIYGFAVTNSQTVFAYTYLFSQFFEIMRTVPQIIITDEERSIYHALRSLKAKGVFTGTHLFDMFHVLRKTNKNCEQPTFRQIIKLIHAKNRMEYRLILKKMICQVVDDRQLAMLRNFDLNSEKYCYSQIASKFVGIGVSNNVNQFFHCLVKWDIPRRLPYHLAVQIILEIIERRFVYSKIPTISKLPLQKITRVNYLAPYKIKFSGKVFGYILKEMQMAHACRIISLKQQNSRNLLPKRREYIKAMERQQHQRNHYYVEDSSGIFLVFRSARHGAGRQFCCRNFKWVCTCGLQERSGVLCAHTAKVLLILDLDFLDNLHQRWFIQVQQVEKMLQKKCFLNTKIRRRFEKDLYQHQNPKIEKVFKSKIAQNNSNPRVQFTRPKGSPVTQTCTESPSPSKYNHNNLNNQNLKNIQQPLTDYPKTIGNQLSNIQFQKQLCQNTITKTNGIQTNTEKRENINQDGLNKDDKRSFVSTPLSRKRSQHNKKKPKSIARDYQSQMWIFATEYADIRKVLGLGTSKKSNSDDI